MCTGVKFLFAVAFAALPLAGAGVTYQGWPGPGNGKYIIMLAGDDGEYHSEEALPALAKILAVHYGFKCTVLFCINPDDGTIDPREKRNMPGLEDLKKADLMVEFMRWRDLPDDQIKYFVDYVQSGRPIISMRTGTHPFWFKTSKTYAKWSWNSKTPGWVGGFGGRVLGETWVAHWGKHGQQSTRALFAPDAASSPILRGIKNGEIWVTSEVYELKLPMPPTCKPLLLGQVLSWVGPDGVPVASKNNPMMPVAWTNHYTAPNGKTARVFATTMGAADDLETESFRRLMVNAVFWALGMDKQIPAKANVSFIGHYRPHSFMSEVYTAGVKPSDLALSPKKKK